jgi:hypothetical protein
MEAEDYSETLLHIYQTSKHLIAEDRDIKDFEMLRK